MEQFIFLNDFLRQSVCVAQANLKLISKERVLKDMIKKKNHIQMI
jgi:hypothetical protein